MNQEGFQFSKRSTVLVCPKRDLSFGRDPSNDSGKRQETRIVRWGMVGTTCRVVVHSVSTRAESTA